MESNNQDIFKANQNSINESVEPQEKEIKLHIETNYQVEPQDHSPLINATVPIITSLYTSQGWVNDLDFIWKLQIKKQKFTSSFNQFQSVKSRDNIDNYIGLIYVFYHSSMSGSLICLFQNGMRLNEEEFKREMIAISNQYKDNRDSNCIINHKVFNTLNDNLNGDIKTVTQSSVSPQKDSSLSISSDRISSQYSKNNNSHSSLLEGLQGENIHSNPNSMNNSDTKSYLQSNEVDANSNSNYDVALNLTLIDVKSINATYKCVLFGKMIIKEMQLNTNNLMNLEEESIMVIEMKRSKNCLNSTKFTGLINEGMTCYMNSMIQSLNVLGYFKKGVFRMPFEGTSTVAYSLQRLFYELTFENESASTARLIESFGWSRDLIFVQHDVQEFNMMLSDLMEKKMQGTKAEGSFKFLFEGKILNCIQCIDYEYTSKKEEIFNDLQLNVKGCKNIYESLNKFTEEEILDNEDKYFVEGHGKEKAKKMLRFLSLPPVLIFQLKRFEYNPKKGEMDKLNDYFEFEPILDMSAYLPEDQKTDAQYALISIVVHRGNVHGGHYYSFIRSNIDHDDWYCFNDEIVKKADLYEVFNVNYGGTYTLFRHRDRGNITELHPSSDLSAYILIYIKVNQAETILSQITIEDIPEDIIKAIQTDKEREKQEMLLRERKEKYMDIFLLSKETLCTYQGVGISRGNTRISLDPITYEDPNYLTSINIPKNLKVIDLYKAFISIYHCNSIDLFLFCLRNPNRITKRNDYVMHYLGDKYLEVELNDLLYEINENTKIVKRVYIYISVKKNNGHFASLSRKDNNLIEEEETSFIFQSTHFHFLFFIPPTNKYELNQERHNNREFQLPEETYSLENKKLFIIKRFDFTKNTLEICDSLLIERDNISSLESLKEKTKTYYQLQYKAKGIQKEKPMKIVLFIENTSVYLTQRETTEKGSDNQLNDSFIELNDIINYEDSSVFISDNPFIAIIYDFSQLLKDNCDSDSFIIIPYVYYEENESATIPLLDQIYHIYSLYKYRIVIPLCFNPSFSFSLVKLSHLVFYLNESDDEIKARVFNNISTKYFEQMLSLEKESNNCYIYNGNKQLLPLTDFCQTLTTDNLSLIKRNNSESFEYPLLRYIGNFNKNAYELEFDIHTILDKEGAQFTQLLLGLIDTDFNPIADVDIHLPLNISFVSEIIEYIFEPILNRFYSGSNYTKDQYQMLYYYSSKNYLVYSMPGRINLIEQNKKAISILKYVLMPKIEDNNKTFVIAVAFQTTSNVALCQPILLFETTDVLVCKVKNDIFEKIRRMTKLKANQSIDCSSLKKMKFYTYSIINYVLNKEILIISNKDNEALTTLYKESTFGLLVEFLPNAPEK